MKEKFQRTLESVKSFFQTNATKLKKIHLPGFFKKIGQAYAILWEKAKLFLKSTTDFKPPAKEKVVSFILQWWHWVLGAVFAFIILYYPAGALLSHRIDTNPRFAEHKTEEGSQVLNTLAELIDREIDKHAFTPNLPFIFPSAVLDNMPAFQTGIIRGVEKSVAVFAALNHDDANLKRSETLLSYPSSVWHVRDWKPAVSSVKKYRTARHLILEYENAVGEGKNTFNTSEQALGAVVSALAENLKQTAQVLDGQVVLAERKIIDLEADNIFYAVKGEAYVYFLVLRDLKEDFKDKFTDESLEKAWEKAMASLKKALRLQPLIVINASPETQFAPNHLLGLGFYLMQTSLNLMEMNQIIQR